MSPARLLDSRVSRDNDSDAYGDSDTYGTGFSAGQSARRCGRAPLPGPQRTGMIPIVTGELSRLMPRCEPRAAGTRPVER